MDRSTIISLAVMILLVSASYILAPPSHTVGKYRAEIKINYEEMTAGISFEFSIVHPNELVKEEVVHKSVTIVNGHNITITARGFSAYPLEPGVKVDYTINIFLDGELIPIRPTQVTAMVRLPNGHLEKALIMLLGNELIFRFAIRYKSKIAIATLVLIAYLWLTEPIPLVASALLVPIIAVILGIMTAKEALAPMFDPVIALFLGGFLLARAMNKYGLDKRIAINIIARARSPVKLSLAMMFITCFLSFWMSNTAVAALMIPIALAILKTIEQERGSNYGKMLVLGVAYSATIGGMGTIIGTPPNAIAVSMLKSLANIEISFLDWMIYAAPFTFLLLLIAFAYLYLVLPVKEDLKRGKVIFAELSETVIKIQLAEMGKMKREEKLTAMILIVTVLLWFSQKLPFKIMGWSGHGISSGIIALIAGVLLFALGLLDKEDLGKISWETLLIFGGGLVLGEMLVLSGMSEYVATSLIGVGNAFIILMLLGFVSLIVTAFASNTAAAAILIPLAIPIGSALGISPVIPALIVAIASSTDFALPIGTPPTMIAYSTGYFKFREMVKIGFPLMIIGVLLVVLVMSPLWLFMLS
ncbi:MAG: SLC13 family permease [Candidatus Njordarchaeales archaeon]